METLPEYIRDLDIDNARITLSQLMMYLDRIRAWIPRCPECGRPLTQKLAGRNLYCPYCNREYRLIPA